MSIPIPLQSNVRRRAALVVAVAVVASLCLGGPPLPVVATATAAAATTTVVSVSPDTGLIGGQSLTVTVSGLTPGNQGGWCQAVEVPPGIEPSTDYCGTNTTYGATIDPSGEITGTVRVERYIYVPALARWVDCADPTEACFIGAADSTDIPGTAAAAALTFAPAPEPPAVRGGTEISPDDVNPGDTVSVTGWGFSVGAVVNVYQCEILAQHPSQCALASAVTTVNPHGSFQALVTAQPTITPPGGSTTDCFVFPLQQDCGIIVAEAADFEGTFVPGGLLPHPTIIPPSILPGVVYQLEGDSGPQSFALPITLSHPSTTTATANWQIIKPVGAPDFQADSPSDYDGSSIVSSGTVSFAPGETFQTVAITVVGDTAPEPDEYIVVKFSSPTLSFVGGYWGLGFAEIANDD